MLKIAAKSCQSGRDDVTHGGARKQHVSARAATKPRGGAYNEQWLTKSGRSKARAVTGWAGMPKGRRFDVSRGKSGKLQVTVSVSSAMQGDDQGDV